VTKTGRRALLGAALASPALAQAPEWPRTTLRIVSPFAPGGVTDTAARLMAPGLQAALGQAVVVENRTGAGGTVAAEAVARAADGHTLLMTTGSTQSIAPALFPSLRYDPVRDLLPVSFVARVPHVLLVPPSLGVSDLAGLLALLRREPGRHNYASTGAGSIPHLAGEMFRLQTGVEATHVPFRGSAPALTELVAGRVSYLIDALPPAIGFINEGRLRAAGAGTRERIPQKPDIATLAEQGLPRFESYTWAALYLSAAGAAPAAVARLHAAAVRAAREAEARMAELGYQVVASTPEELAAIQRSEFEKWGSVIRQAGIKPEA
jgi:tripartite-type tricarboxylate transporter receptor subunit TctC